MAVSDNSFQFVNDVQFQVLDAVSNTLATSMKAIPYRDFDNDAKKGTSRRLAYPVLMNARDGIEYDPNDMDKIVQRFRYITLNDGVNTSFPIDYQQATFEDSVDGQMQFSEMYLVPAARKQGNKLNTRTILEMVVNFSDTIGDPTQPLNGINTMSNINSQMANMGLSHFKKKYFQMSPNATGGVQIPYVTYFNQDFNSSILNGDTTVFNKDYSGIMPYIDQNYFDVQNGVFTGAGNITVDTAPVNAPQTLDVYSEGPSVGDINAPYATLTIEGFTVSTTGVLLQYNRIWFQSASTLADKVFMVNVDNGKAFGVAKTFVVLSDGSGNPVISSDGAGAAQIRIFPPVIPSVVDPYKNVSRPIAVGDKVNLFGPAGGTYTLNFAFVDQGLRFSNPPFATYILGSGQTGFGGFPYQQVMSSKIPNSEMTLSTNLSASGNHPMFTNNISLRSLSAAAAFNGYGFAVATTSTVTF